MTDVAVFAGFGMLVLGFTLLIVAFWRSMKQDFDRLESKVDRHG
ncbi:hypothetical protein [Kineosporia sp. NBRC 101731]|nr:hypothetical protein [Kineosporia sp. NBRC 101731]